MRISDRLSMGLHYAETLRLWDERFLAQQEAVHALGFDSVFDRMWHFYLEYSRAGFASQYIDVQQITFAREDSMTTTELRPATDGTHLMSPSGSRPRCVRSSAATCPCG